MPELILATADQNLVRTRAGAEPEPYATAPAQTPDAASTGRFSRPAGDFNQPAPGAKPPSRGPFDDIYRISVRIPSGSCLVTGRYLRDTTLVSDSYLITDNYPLAIG